MTSLMLSLASLTLPPVDHLHAADVFTKITAGAGSGVANSRGGAWGDYDGDGFIDLFVPQTGPGGVGSASHFLYHNNTNGTFSRVTNGPVAAVVSAGFGAAWGDYDNDRNLDLVLVNENQPNYLFRNNGDGSFSEVPSASVVSDLGNSRGVTWVDYDNDGYLDLFRTVLNFEPRLLYQNNHDGTFTHITQGDFLTVRGSFLGVAWGDYNNDGRHDVFLPNSNEGAGFEPNYLYRNDGDGRFIRVGAGPLDGNSNSGAAAWGDCDNDGDLDLFVSSAGSPISTGDRSRTNFFYRNDGNDTFTSLTSLPANDPENQGGVSGGCNWGDYDNDAFLDLFVGTDGSANLLYHNNGNTNHWLKFRLIGTCSNRAAIGAKVRVRATINGQTFWQMREVPGGDGLRGQNSLHVHFGLGNATNADLVRIEWPSGTVQELLNVAAQQFLTVTEPGGEPQLAATQQNGQVQLTLTGKQGSRYAIETSTALSNWISADLMVTITNQNGAGVFPVPGATNDAQSFYRAVWQ